LPFAYFHLRDTAVFVVVFSDLFLDFAFWGLSPSKLILFFLITFLPANHHYFSRLPFSQQIITIFLGCLSQLHYDFSSLPFCQQIITIFLGYVSQLHIFASARA
jgi:hypothetical protein